MLYKDGEEAEERAGGGGSRHTFTPIIMTPENLKFNSRPQAFAERSGLALRQCRFEQSRHCLS